MKVSMKVLIAMSGLAVLPAVSQAAVSSSGESIAVPYLEKTSQTGFVAVPKHTVCRLFINGLVSVLVNDDLVATKSIQYTDAIPNAEELASLQRAAAAAAFKSGPSANPDTGWQSYSTYLPVSKPAGGPHAPQNLNIKQFVLKSNQLGSSGARDSNATAALVEIADKNCD